MASESTTRRGPPDFTFPPRYSAKAASGSEDGSRPKSPMCIVPQNPSPSPKILPDIITSITPLDLTSHSFPGKLLTIPIEIRLQIYSYVLLSHPIRHPHLASTDATSDTSTQQEFRTKLLQPLGRSEPNALTTLRKTLTVVPSFPTADMTTTYPVSHPSISLPRTQGKIPTGLLASCLQIYSEIRLLPFHDNHFTFVNWFWSGVYAAKQFTRGLRPWQSDALRYVSLEVQGKGLGGDEKQCKDWKIVCGLWGGVWELKLCVKGSVGMGVMDGSSGFNGDGLWDLDADIAVQQSDVILDVRREWIAHGLVKMKSLRVLELEIEDMDVEREVELEFCRELEEVLKREDGAVKVVFVERVTVDDERAFAEENKGLRCD